LGFTTASSFATVCAQVSYDEIDQAASVHGLMIMGGYHPDANDPKDPVATRILLGADRSFWQVFTLSAELSDSAADPIDRWSKRIIGGLARQVGAQAMFPSDGPPYAPFISWALATGRFHQSPTGMMVHDKAGLMISIRGALAFDRRINLPDLPARDPCESCVGRPCETSCPVGALSADRGYDVPNCKSYLKTEAGAGSCMAVGCRVRNACPISREFDRPPAQSAFHMRAFLGV